MPLVQTRGAASAQGFGEFAQASAVPNYIEDVFSTYLYTGTTSTQTFNNGIDLSTKGGLVWIKKRTDAYSHYLTDSARGVGDYLSSNDTGAQDWAGNSTDSVTSFNTNGFTVGADTSLGWVNNGNINDKFASWTFRKQPKFFDVVTFTKSSSPQTISHNLGSTPGCIFIKRTDSTGAWLVAHRGYTGGITAGYTLLNTTAAFTSNANAVTAADSTTFTLGSAVVSGDFVAYLFAHDAGGFGLTGTDNVISCGTYTTSGSGSATVSLGYEPQWVLTKATSGTYGTTDWVIADNMRGMPAPPQTDGVGGLFPNLSDAEDNNFNRSVHPTSTGFVANQYNSTPYIYIAIRRGPMKVPTDATKVFGLSARTGTGANATVTGGQTDDAVLIKNRGSAVASLFASRLTNTNYLVTSSTAAQVAAGTTILQANPWDVMDGVKVGTTSTITNASGSTFINYLFKRAPSFMDVVAYTGTGTSSATQTHNLGVVPELIILKCRTITYFWYVFSAYATGSDCLLLDRDFAWSGYGNPARTSTTFTVTAGTESNDSGATYVAYLFATCPGVSKVGSYTGNGTTKTVDCGFGAGGARFVLIKRTDDTGSWYVYDTARGMTVLTDPYFLANSTAAEVATLGSVTTVSTGFAVNATILAAINTNAASYIFLAIA